LNHSEIKLPNLFYFDYFLIVSTNPFFYLIFSLERQVILAYNENVLYFFTLN